MKNLILFLSTFVCLFSSCKKEQTTFSGVTYRDDSGNQIGGTPDTEDWLLNDNWNGQERSLFSVSNNSLCSSNSSIQVIAYPNPNLGNFNIHTIGTDSTQTISLRVVNQNFDVLTSRDNVSSNDIHLSVQSLITSNQIVRVYYKISENDCEYRGHGDIQIQLH